jgi:homoserine kinase
MTPIYLKLPATSANLGPGFDAVGLAMRLYLTIEAEEAREFAIDASGRDSDLCGALEGNLILTTYLALLGSGAPKLRLKLHNEIPLGMGCGSSAAALLAGVVLANHFGALGWSPQAVLEEACRREGHPDNVAACFYGGMTVSSDQAGRIVATTCGETLGWRLLLALPRASLATEKARALLPETYSRADAVVNVQNTALLVAAFALDRPELLQVAMQDRIHQPYRMAACPLLPKLLPLMGTPAVYGVALSGAGPSVLLIADPALSVEALCVPIWELAGDPGMEIVETRVAAGLKTQLSTK